jgi:hypothetical protein
MAFSFFGLFKYTESTCAKEIIKTLKKISSSTNPIYEPQKNQVRYQLNGKDGFVYLGNIYNHLKSKSRQERYEYLHSFISNSLEEADITYENSANLLIPRLKSKAEIANRMMYINSLDATPPTYFTSEFTSSFVWELGIDSGATVKIVSSDILEQLTLTKDEAMAIAKKNLFSISENNFFEEIEKGFYLSRYEDDHDAARILMTDVISGLHVNGYPVAFVPAAKVLLICGSQDVTILNNIHNYLDRWSENCRPLSRQPLILIDGVWQDFIPEDKMQFASVINQIRIEEYRSYDEQKSQINALHESKKIDIFVSSYLLYERTESQLLFSTATWSESVHSWIPKAETISFVINDGKNGSFIGEVKFEDVLTNFPELVQPLGYVPELYEVKEFPDKTKLEKLIIKT